jgi:hypothetical protein
VFVIIGEKKERRIKSEIFDHRNILSWKIYYPLQEAIRHSLGYTILVRIITFPFSAGFSKLDFPNVGVI